MDTKEQQFTEIIRMYERTIYTVCHMFSDNTDEVNDLYQEILVRLWKGFDAFKGTLNVIWPCSEPMVDFSVTTG